MRPLKIIALLTTIVFLSVQPAFALPTGASVAAGEAQFSAPTDHDLTVTTSDRAVINYDRFNIGSQESVRFIQPSASSLVLNRVIGGDPSSILGNLSANGRVFVVNPNGIFFGPQSHIDAGSFIASTLSIGNEDFLQRNFVFKSDGSASVVNQGTITASEALALLGRDVVNEGLVVARQGTVALASGAKVTLDLTDDGLLGLALEGEAAQGGIHNSGLIRANDGQVLLTARVMGDAFAEVINNDGAIEATSMVNDGGVVRLVSEGNGVVSHTGAIDVTGAAHGGRVDILGKYVGLFGDALIDASGETGGGTVLLGRNDQGAGSSVGPAQGTFMNTESVIRADALGHGNGGRVILWSDGTTRASGLISARGGALGGDGGFVETSGLSLQTDNLQVDASAPSGDEGQWLLDPYDITIDTSNTVNGSFNAANPNVFTPSATGAVVDRDDIETSLNAGTSVTVRTTGGGGAETGDITVNATITKSAGADATLRLTADRDIIINNAISATNNTGKLHMIFVSGRTIDLKANLTSQGGSVDLTAANNIDASAGVVTINADAYDSGANADGTSSDGVGLTATAGSIGATNAINISASGDNAGGGNAGSDGGNAGGLVIGAATSATLGTVTMTGGDAVNGAGAGAANGGTGGDITGSTNGALTLGTIDLSGGDSNSTDGGNGGNGGTIVLNAGTGTVGLQAITSTGGTGYINGDAGAGGILNFTAGSAITVNNTLTTTSGNSGPGGNSASGGDIFLTSNTDITLNGANADIFSNGALFWFLADNDANGSGTYTQNHAGSAVTTANGFVTVKAADVALTGTIDVGTTSGEIDVHVQQDGATIGLGATAGGLTLSGAELQNMTAAVLNLGFLTNGNITVDNISAANSNNIGTVWLRAQHDNARVLFSNNASTFNALSVRADDGVDVNVSVTSDTGELTFDGDADNAADTNDNVDIAGGVTLSSGTTMSLSATTGGVLLSGASGTTVVLDANGDVLMTLARITDSSNSHLTATSEGSISLNGGQSLGTGTYSFTADNDNDSTDGITLNGTITGNSTLTLSGGGTGTNDDLDLNADITTRVLTIQNFAAVDLAASVDLVANLGALNASANVGVINFSGANGTTNVIDGNNDAAVTLAPITDTNNINLTVTSDGSLTMAGITNAGQGIYTLMADIDDDSTATLALNGAITGSASLSISGGGTGTNDDFDVNADITANSLTIQNFASVDLAGDVDLTANVTAIMASLNVGVINLSGADGTTNTLTTGGDGAVSLAPITDTNNPDLLVYSEGNITLNGMTNFGGGFVNFIVDNDDDGSATLAVNAPITGQGLLTFTAGGAVGSNTTDTLDINADITGNDLVMQVFNVADLASSVDLTALSGIVELGTVNQVNLSGANGTTNVFTSQGIGSYVELAEVTDTNNVNLTVNTEGDIYLLGLTGLGSGTYTFNADSNNDGTALLRSDEAITGSAALVFSGGGTGTDDTFDVNADISAGSLTIANFAAVDLAGGVDWTISGAIAVASNVALMNLSGAGGAVYTITGGNDADVSLAAMTDTNNVDLTVSSQGDLNWAGATNLGTGGYTFSVDSDNDGARTLTVSGDVTGLSNLTFNGSGDNDTLTVNGDVTANAITTDGFVAVNVGANGSLSAGGSGQNLVVTSPLESNDTVNATTAGSILDNGDAAIDIQSGSDATLVAGGGVIGTAADPLEVSIGGQLFVSASGKNGNLSAVLTGQTSDGFVHLLTDTPGVVVFNSRIVGGEGADTINDHIGHLSSGLEAVDVGAVGVPSGVADAAAGTDFQFDYNGDFLTL